MNLRLPGLRVATKLSSLREVPLRIAPGTMVAILIMATLLMQPTQLAFAGHRDTPGAALPFFTAADYTIFAQARDGKAAETFDDGSNRS